MLQQTNNHSTITTLLTTSSLIILLAVGLTSAQEQQKTAETSNLRRPGDNQNPKYAIKLTMYKGSSEEVRPIIEKMNSLINTEQTAKRFDFVQADDEGPEGLRAFELGLPESEHQIDFGNTVKQLKNSEVTLIAEHERSAEFVRGSEICRLNQLGKIEFDVVGDQFTVTPSSKNGKICLSVNLLQSELDMKKMIKMKAPDGSIVESPQLSSVVSQFSFLTQPKSAVVAVLPSKISGEQTLVKIECSNLSPDQ